MLLTKRTINDLAFSSGLSYVATAALVSLVSYKMAGFILVVAAAWFIVYAITRESKSKSSLRYNNNNSVSISAEEAYRKSAPMRELVNETWRKYS
jgi:hypothetical protein